MFTMSRVVLKGPERRSGALRFHLNTDFEAFYINVIWNLTQCVNFK